MKPINVGGHSAYQDRVLNQLRKYYPNALKSLSSSTWQILGKFLNLDLCAIDLKENHLHSIISGFNVGDTPDVGTFYDLHKRLWLSDNNNLSDSVHPPREKPLKSKGKEEKDTTTCLKQMLCP